MGLPAESISFAKALWSEDVRAFKRPRRVFRESSVFLSDGAEEADGIWSLEPGYRGSLGACRSHPSALGPISWRRKGMSVCRAPTMHVSVASAASFILVILVGRCKAPFASVEEGSEAQRG